MLLNKLQTTQSKQTQAYRSLESMVQVGYNYYSQCYELKKKKQADMLPGMAGVAKGTRQGAGADSVNGRPEGGPGIYMNRGMQNARSPKTGALVQSQSVKKLQKKKQSMGPGPGMSANQSAAAAEFYGSNQAPDSNAPSSSKQGPESTDSIRVGSGQRSDANTQKEGGDVSGASSEIKSQLREADNRSLSALELGI